MALGGAELLILVVIGLLTWGLPAAAFIWAMVMLYRIRTGQDAIRVRLEAIEQSIQRAP